MERSEAERRSGPWELSLLSEGQLAARGRRPGGAVGEDTQPGLVLPFHLIDLDLKAGVDELAGKDLLAVLRMEAAGVIELNQTSTSDSDAVGACSFQNEVVGEALEGGVDALQAEKDVEHAVTAGAVTEARMGDGASVVAGGGEDAGEILEGENELRAHREPPAAVWY